MDLSDLIPSSVTWGDLILAVVAVLAGWILSHFARKGIIAVGARARGLNPMIATAIARAVAYAILLLAIGIALALLGANVQPLLAIVIIVAVVLVLVLRGVADNFAAGVLLQARRTVDVGDEIQVEGPDGMLVGRVTELNARSVVFVTRDGRTVHMPNAVLLGNALINDSRHGARRGEVQVRVASAGVDLDDLVTTLTNATAEAPGVHTHEKTRTLIVTVSPDRIIARVQFWHHPLKSASVTSDVVVALTRALQAAHLTGTVTSDAGDPPLTPPDRL